MRASSSSSLPMGVGSIAATVDPMSVSSLKAPDGVAAYAAGAAAYERRSQNDGCGALCERAGEGAHGSPSEKGKFELQYSVIPRAVPNAPSRVR